MPLANQIVTTSFNQHEKNAVQASNIIILLKNYFVLTQSNQLWHCQYGEHSVELNQSQSHEDVTWLHFQISCDEEHVRLSIKHNGKTAELGERVHHYPLLLLARKYRQDQQSGFDHTCCGWLDVEQLTKMIGIETSVLNVQLHRAKQQFSQVISTKHLIERRIGQIRLNASNVEIIRGACVE